MEKTEAAKLADEYVRLGGRRRSKLDDNKVSTRKWEQETPEAAAFWKKNIEPLDERHQKEVVTLLPSINTV